MYIEHIWVGDILPSPRRPQCKKNHGPKKYSQACSSLYAENPDESSGIHLMIESGQACIIFSIMENFTLHHNCNMFQASLIMF